MFLIALKLKVAVANSPKSLATGVCQRFSRIKSLFNILFMPIITLNCFVLVAVLSTHQKVAVVALSLLESVNRGREF